MKKLRLLIIGFLAAVSTYATADDYAYLQVEQDGSASQYTVSDIKNITFDTENMILNLTNGEKATLPLASLSKLFFTNTKSETGEETGIAALGAAGKIRLEGNTLRINAENGEKISLYNTGGQIVRSMNASGHDTTISLEGLRKGVYIIRVGSEARKIMNK